ncbi:hypothetical protein HOLleu_44009 [Holothuria leucospilota]|uniref:Uncharacterized protein n=1 Tax=Holothuria leucospilota TaxID=206669 RepID=A0A9Q1BAP8_HOLLE|nr:hypothetical protein HOLleu_44009 [Holothuria leucospilota]
MDPRDREEERIRGSWPLRVRSRSGHDPSFGIAFWKCGSTVHLCMGCPSIYAQNTEWQQKA